MLILYAIDIAGSTTYAVFSRASGQFVTGRFNSVAELKQNSPGYANLEVAGTIAGYRMRNYIMLHFPQFFNMIIEQQPVSNAEEVIW